MINAMRNRKIKQLETRELEKQKKAQRDQKTEEMMRQNQLQKGNDRGKRPFTFDFHGDIIMI